MEGKRKQFTREELYERVWSKTLTKLSFEIGVSASYLTRVCRRLNVPKPGRGYWARIAAGETATKPSLSPTQPGDEIVWIVGGGSLTAPREPIRHSVDLANPKKKLIKPSNAMHPLLIGAKVEFEAGKAAHDYCYLRPNKRLLVDVLSTRNCLNKTLSFTNRLFLMLDACGYEVSIAAAGESLTRVALNEQYDTLQSLSCGSVWYPYRPTVFRMGTMAIGVTILELFEEADAYYEGGRYQKISHAPFSGKGRSPWASKWITKHRFPTGRLCLQTYSPYHGVDWTKEWKEEKRNLGKQIPEIIKEIERYAPKLLRMLKEAEMQAEIMHKEFEAQQRERQAEHEKWLKEVAEKQRMEAIEQCEKQLQRIIADWDEANRNERFFLDLEKYSEKLEEAERVELCSRLEIARKFIGPIDAVESFKKWNPPRDG